MTTPSNLYAEKIFAEHPTMMWSLDDDVNYVSLITEANRSLTVWNIENGSATSTAQIPGQPFLDSAITLIEGAATPGDSYMICRSPNIINFQEMSGDLKTFSIGAYFYSNSPYLTKVSIGYEYNDTTSPIVITEFKDFETSVFNTWSFISGTFKIPNESSSLRIVLRFFYDGGGGSSDYQFYVNGVTLGQWSEDFNTYSLGVDVSPLPLEIPIDNMECVTADAYGIAGKNGYYLSKNNKLFARNAGIPMVYGSSDVTRITPNPDGPSLIIPGYGFLNKSGQYKEYTAEFWIKINSGTSEAKKIFGPISSNDGVYVEEGFITLVIGKNFESYFVGEWFRPMLVQIRLLNNSASMIINGAEVINFSINTASLTLPDIYDEFGKEQDWLGFYAYEDVPLIELDAVAIYSYSVPVNVAKRRWVYGQGVISPESINSAYSGTQAYIDYPFADYTANYNYPDFAKWEQATFDNLFANRFSLSNPNYELPNIFLNNKTLQDLYDDNQEIQILGDYKFVTFRPNESWNIDPCYFNFQKFNILQSKINSIYGVFSTDNLVSTETLLLIYNQITKNSFIIYKEADVIKYVLNYNGIAQEIYSTSPIVEDDKFVVGIKIDTLVDVFGGNTAAFFGNKNGVQVYIGGEGQLNSQFTGKIYSVGISTVKNSDEISEYFDSSGIAMLDDYFSTGYVEPTNALTFLNHIASYTLLPFESYGKYFLDISISGSWQDYMPLSYFAQFVKNDSGGTYYDLDFLQFNIGYPAPTKLKEVQNPDAWTYQDLKLKFEDPELRTYADLDNPIFTGWNSYEELKDQSIKYLEYDTENASIRSYITLQYIAQGANAPDNYFTSVVPVKEDRIIDFNEYSDWDITKFEVVDNTLIYPTKTVDFNELAIVYSLDFKIKGILTRPINLRRLELASQALNSSDFNPIGTRFGVDIFPYIQSGIYFDYKSKNPLSIYKKSTPYLYLNKTSGIELRGDIDSLVNRGIALPINENEADDYRISAVQLWLKTDLQEFGSTPVKLFEVEHKADKIVFYMEASGDSGKRARIFAKNEGTGLDFNGLAYYLNGHMVREPVITSGEWAVLGVRFNSALIFDFYLGSINLNGPAVFNNVAFYQSTNLQQIQSKLTRPWLDVKTDGVDDIEWVYWKDNFLWDGVLVVGSTDLYGVDPSVIYNTYIGTNKIIVDDGSALTIDEQNMKVYSDITWSNSIRTPV